MPHYWLRLLKTIVTNSKNNCVYRSVTLTSPSSTGWVPPGCWLTPEGVSLPRVEGPCWRQIMLGLPMVRESRMQRVSGPSLARAHHCTSLVWFLSKIPITPPHPSTRHVCPNSFVHLQLECAPPVRCLWLPPPSTQLFLLRSWVKHFLIIFYCLIKAIGSFTHQ